MSFEKIYSKPVNNPQHVEQPWYVNWSEGNLYALLLNIFVDTLFISSILGLIAVIFVPQIFNADIFLLSMIFTSIPLMSISSLYYKYIYHYESSLSTYSVKPSLMFIILYEFCIIFMFSLLI